MTARNIEQTRCLTRNHSGTSQDTALNSVLTYLTRLGTVCGTLQHMSVCFTRLSTTGPLPATHYSSTIFARQPKATSRLLWSSILFVSPSFIQRWKAFLFWMSHFDKHRLQKPDGRVDKGLRKRFINGAHAVILLAYYLLHSIGDNISQIFQNINVVAALVQRFQMHAGVRNYDDLNPKPEDVLVDVFMVIRYHGGTPCYASFLTENDYPEPELRKTDVYRKMDESSIPDNKDLMRRAENLLDKDNWSGSRMKTGKSGNAWVRPLKFNKRWLP